MVSDLRAHLTYANVMATIAVFLALGGGAYALTLPSNSVQSRHIGKGQVKTSDIGKGQVKRSDIGPDAITSAKVENFSLDTDDFGPTDQEQLRGPQGDKGDSGVANLKVRAVAGTDRVTAACQPGEHATGGGAHSVNGYLVASAPASHPLSIYVPDGISFQEYAPISWTASADDGSGNPADVTTWVVCAAP